MTDNEFQRLEDLLRRKIIEIDALQKLYREQTGRDYVLDEGRTPGMKSIEEIVLKAEKENKVVFMTMDGPRSVDLDKFVSQPIEGLLYDLNRNRSTVLTFIDDPKFVNDFAVMRVITKLKELLEVNNAGNDIGKRRMG